MVTAHISVRISSKPILYDTSDFIDDYAINPVLRNDHSCLFKEMFMQGQLRRIELIPVTLEVAHVTLARGEDFKAIGTHMEKHCPEQGTSLIRLADRLAYEV